ncbi:MAG: hypothetical protein Q9P01_04510 [Anaerolineae bacterium]|nr:hypothetical protein [Anaerolineae bacterium]MDQ7034103.1 hypothetical protein [Anaerolineae bacterium]
MATLRLLNEKITLAAIDEIAKPAYLNLTGAHAGTPLQFHVVEATLQSTSRD